MALSSAYRANAQPTTTELNGAVVRLQTPFELALATPARPDGIEKLFMFGAGETAQAITVRVDREACADEGVNGRHDALCITVAVVRAGATSYWSLASPDDCRVTVGAPLTSTTPGSRSMWLRPTSQSSASLIAPRGTATTARSARDRRSLDAPDPGGERHRDDRRSLLRGRLAHVRLM